MDIHGDYATVRMNWTLWRTMLDILKEHGFTGELPGSNDGEGVIPSDGEAVGRAILMWWDAKREVAQLHPKLEPWESTILAYALLLVTEKGQVKHL